MKNRKSSAMWGVAIVLILGLAYFMNATSWLTKPLFPAAPKPAAQTGDGPTEAQTSASLMNAEKSRTMQMRGEEGGEADAGNPAEPAIFKKKVQAYKPQPNPTSTSSQWWDDDGYVEKQREETEKQRGF